MPDNPFLSYLEDQPESGYFSYQNQWNSPNMKRFFQSQFGNIQNQYLGQFAGGRYRSLEPLSRAPDRLYRPGFNGNTVFCRRLHRRPD